MGINTGWGGGGAGGPITVDDITATGTPGATTFLRGDGAWAGAGTGVTLGSDSLESDGSTITIDLSASPITDAQYFRVNFEFEVDGACDVMLLLNGDTDGTGYFVNGSENIATISSLPGAGAQRGGGINITPSANSGGNLVCFGVADIWNTTSTIGDASLKWFRTLTGLTGITQIQLKTTANNFKAGSNVTITQVSGVGPKGDTGATGATGPAGADGEGAVPWQTATQASNGNTLTLTLDPTGAEFEIVVEVLSQTNGSLIEMELNESAGSYSYYQQYNGVPDSGAGSYFLPGAVNAGGKATFAGIAMTQDTTAKAVLYSGVLGVGVSQAMIYKTLGAAAPLSAITIKSSGANGIGAGSFIRARKIS